jgi:hypothetical protein
VDTSTRVAGAALKAAGNGVRRAVVVAAVKYRKEDQMRLYRPQSGSGTTFATPSGTTPGNQPQTPSRTTIGTGRNQDPTQVGTTVSLLRETPVPSVTKPTPHPVVEAVEQALTENRAKADQAKAHPDYTQRALPAEELF